MYSKNGKRPFESSEVLKQESAHSPRMYMQGPHKLSQINLMPGESLVETESMIEVNQQSTKVEDYTTNIDSDMRIMVYDAAPQNGL